VEKGAMNGQELLSLIEFGNSVRTTHATPSNDTSSRSHAICQVESLSPFAILLRLALKLTVENALENSF